jgi:ATP-dependent Clp protease ATP-binding subunit ClpA
LHTAIDLALTIPARHLERWMRRLGLRGSVFLQGWTEGARRAIYLARLEAASFNRREIGPEHLLVGTLRTDEPAGALLGPNGFEEIVRALETQEAHPRRVLPQRERNHIPLALDCKRALARAWEEARNSGAKLGSHHLLRVILREDASTAARLLRQRGLDPSSL